MKKLFQLVILILSCDATKFFITFKQSMVHLIQTVQDFPIWARGTPPISQKMIKSSH